MPTVYTASLQSVYWLTVLCKAVAHPDTVHPREELLSCGNANYYEEEYTCYDGNFLCPVLGGIPAFRCNEACYLASEYSCASGQLIQVDATSSVSTSYSASATTIPASVLPPIPSSSPPPCESEPSELYLSSTPYANYLLSTCHVQAHLILTSPAPSSNLTIIGPRLIAAFPAGNSGVAAFFAPSSGINGSVSLGLVNTTEGSLDQVYIAANGSASHVASVGISAVLELNDSAILTVPLLGSVRTIRDFTEGPSILVPEIQGAIEVRKHGDAVVYERTWLDNATISQMGFIPVSEETNISDVGNSTTVFSAGRYRFWTAYNFPQMDQLSASEVLNPGSQSLIQQQPDETSSLAFLSYTDKLLAGTWRFLTYFGRDSMISALLLQPVLSEGEGGALEAVLGAVLERVNRTDGSVSHEETLGDYATYLNKQNNISSSDPMYTYPMIDTDYYLPVLMQRYFLSTRNGLDRAKTVLSASAGSINPANSNLTLSDLATLNAEKIMAIAGRFAADGNQTIENLAHLKESEVVGQWRDSTFGIGGGRIPYDVNTALMPAALRAVAALSAAGVYPGHNDWGATAAEYAQVWEDETFQFFTTTIPAATARTRLETYSDRSSFPGPSQTDMITSDVEFDAIALMGNNGLERVDVMHTDTCFRLFLLNTTNQEQLTSFLNRTATNIRRRFPAGLLSDVGLLVANPAYGEQEIYAENFTTSAYHGTVVWGWPMAMMARGLELQIARCSDEADHPQWCDDASVSANVRGAYNDLWDVIDENRDVLSGEVWSWRFQGDKFEFVELGDQPPAPGTSPTESDIRQLWSLTFLAVTRNEAFR